MGAELGHGAAELRDAAIGKGAEVGEEGGGGGERALWWWIGEGEFGGRGAPGEAIEQQAGQFGFEHFRAVEGRQAAMQGWGPDADGDARRFSARPPGALLGGGAADAQGGEPGEPGCGIKPWGASPAAIDDNAHAGDGERSFGDGGCQHDAAALGGAQSAVLLGRRQVAVQREHACAAAAERRFGAADFRHAGQERQDVAGVGGER